MQVAIKKRDNLIRNRIFLNPFFWFVIIWSFVLILHTFNFSRAYPKTSDKMYVFLYGVIALSLVLAILFQKLILKNLQRVNISPKPYWGLIIVPYVILVFECILSKNVPLIGALQHKTTYMDFGVPILSGFMYSFAIFVSVICSIQFVYVDRNKWLNFLALILSYGRFVIVYSRGGLVLCLFITAIIFFSKKRLTYKHFIWMIIIIILFALGFNILGNIRMGFSPFDSSYLMEVSQFDKKYSGLSNFSWFLVYLDTPLGNLLYNEKYIDLVKDTNGLMSQLFPSVISEIIFPDYDPNLTLAIPNLTVSSMFAGGFKYYGYMGMFIIFIETASIIFICCLFARGNSFALLGCAAVSSVLYATSFFDNMFYVSGNSFALIYLVLASWFIGRHKYDRLKYEIKSIVVTQ